MARVRAALDRITDPSVRAVINEDAYSHIKPVLRDSLTNNPYACSTEAADVLEKYGIATNPFAVKVHSHAAVKSIENTLLERVGFNLPKEPCTFLFLKKSKLRLLRRGPQNGDIFHNLTLEPRDISRYETETIVPAWPHISTRCAYISDTLHFLSRKAVANVFYHNPMLETLYATLVLPVEAIHRHPSLEPELYTINYSHNGFQYIPGNHGGGAYHHEFETLEWLKVGRFISDKLVVTVQMIESLGANHLFVFHRGFMLTPKVRTFVKDEYVLLPQIFHPKNLNANKPLLKTKAMQLFYYVKSVKNVTERDIYAKLRQIVRTQELANYDPDESVHIVNYFLFVSRLDSVNSYSDVLSLPIWSKALLPVRTKITQFWEKLTGARDFKQLLDALQWKTFTYSIEVQDYKTCPGPTDHFIEVDTDFDNIDPTVEPDEETPTQNIVEQKEIIGLEEADLPWKPWLPLFQEMGITATERQFGPEGEIFPVHSVQNLGSEPEWSDFNGLKQVLNKIKRSPVLVELDQARAAAYGSDVKNGRIGALLKQQSKDWLSSFALKCQNIQRTVPMSVIHGAGGSGKSKALQDWANTLPKICRDLTIVLPTTELRNDWTKKVSRLEQSAFKTFEKALLQPSGKVVIFDDYTKLPQGYIEAFLVNKPNTTVAILTGDPRQSFHHEANVDAYTSCLEPSPQIYDKHCRYYLNTTFRNRKDLANMLQVYSCKPGDTSITMSSQALRGIPILSPSLIKKNALGEMGQRSMTYAGCQGLTAKSVQILLDTNTPLCSSNVIYTALSRATDHIHFINTGPNSTDFWEKLDSTPYLKTFLDTVREKKVNEMLAPEAEPQEVAAPTTHFPKANATTVIEELVEQLPEKHEREIFNENLGHSNAVQTEDPVVQLFAHQQAKDETLYWATIDARLSVTSPEENGKEFRMKKDIGDILFLNYKKAMNLPDDPIPFDTDLWHLCRQEIESTYLKKSAAALVNAAMRQSPDFDQHAIALFLKSQWVKKVEKLGAIKIKPGQTIAAFMQQTVMIYGTMARYMRKWRNKYQPRNVFINCETTNDEFNQWVLDEWNFNRVAMTNDFTAFDQSQDGSILQFEVIKAKFHNIPQDIVQGYIEIKTNAKVFIGTLAIMRLSGEGPTFDANTEANIAYTHAKFNIPDGVCQLYAGDDMAMDFAPVEKPSFSLIAKDMKLESKLVTIQQADSEWPEFCGWALTPKGIIKQAVKMNMSIELNKRIGKMKEVQHSYALDHKYAYRLGDELHDIYTEKEADHHQLATRYLIQRGESSTLNSQ
nr:RNA-dependent RNA polymerase [Daphne virus X]